LSVEKFFANYLFAGDGIKSDFVHRDPKTLGLDSDIERKMDHELVSMDVRAGGHSGVDFVCGGPISALFDYDGLSDVGAEPSASTLAMSSL